MPKATLEFNLPEEKEEFMLAQHGVDYNIVFCDLNQYLRLKVKYPNETDSEEVIKVFQEVRDKLRELLEERGITL